MKKSTIILFALLISYTGFSQSKKVLKQQIVGLTNQVDSLRSVSKNLSEKNGRANKQVDSLKFKIFEMDLDLKTSKRNLEDCKSREERQKSEAIKTQIQAKPENNSINSSNPDSPSIKSTNQSISTGATGEGQKIYTGPRGGRYYINGSGKKVYIKR